MRNIGEEHWGFPQREASRFYRNMMHAFYPGTEFQSTETANWTVQFSSLWVVGKLINKLADLRYLDKGHQKAKIWYMMGQWMSYDGVANMQIQNRSIWHRITVTPDCIIVRFVITLLWKFTIAKLGSYAQLRVFKTMAIHIGEEHRWGTLRFSSKRGK